MIDKLDRRVEDISNLNTKLVLLIGRTGKSKLLKQLSERRKVGVLNVGAALGRELLTVPKTQRHFFVAQLLRDLADNFASHGLLLVDNIELLFDRSLRLRPLDLLKQHARARRVIAVWPGELQEHRLIYGDTGHPEYQSYGIEGLSLFDVKEEAPNVNSI